MKPIEEKGLLASRKRKAVSWFDDCRIPFEETRCDIRKPNTRLKKKTYEIMVNKSKEAIGRSKDNYYK